MRVFCSQLLESNKNGVLKKNYFISNLFLYLSFIKKVYIFFYFFILIIFFFIFILIKFFYIFEFSLGRDETLT